MTKNSSKLITFPASDDYLFDWIRVHAIQKKVPANTLILSIIKDYHDRTVSVKSPEFSVHDYPKTPEDSF